MTGLYDVIIIGGGPAGLAAGIYLSRARRRVLLFEREETGGKARHLKQVENYPGFPAGVSGKQLMEHFKTQALSCGLRVKLAGVERLSVDNGHFAAYSRGKTFRGRSAIICTGAVFKTLGIPGEMKFKGRGVYHSAFGKEKKFSGKTVAVTGGGETAAHQALLLARFAKRVFLVFRGVRIKAIAPLLERVDSNPKIVMIAQGVVKAVKGRGRVESIVIQDKPTGRKSQINVDALFVLIGQVPDLALVKGMEDKPGFYLAGDARGIARQVVIASGDGVRAAMLAEDFLSKWKS